MSATPATDDAPPPLAPIAAPALNTVQCGAVVVTLPTAQADQLGTAWQQQQTEMTALRTQLAETQQSAAATQARLATQLRDAAMHAAVAAAPNLLRPTESSAAQALVRDVAGALAARCRYDAEQNALCVVDADGQPARDASGAELSLDALVAQHLAVRPWLCAVPSAVPSHASEAAAPAALAVDEPQAALRRMFSRA